MVSYRAQQNLLLEGTNKLLYMHFAYQETGWETMAFGTYIERSEQNPRICHIVLYGDLKNK